MSRSSFLVSARPTAGHYRATASLTVLATPHAILHFSKEAKTECSSILSTVVPFIFRWALVMCLRQRVLLVLWQIVGIVSLHDSARSEIVVGDALQQMAAAATSATDVGADQSKMLAPAIEAFKSGDRESFNARYAEASKLSDALPSAEVFFAKLLIESGRLGDAIASLDQYLVTSTEDPEGYVALGEIAIRSQRWTDASLILNHAEELVKAKKLRPSRLVYVVPGLVELRAEVAERRQQWDEAEALFTRLQDLRPEAAYPSWRLGRMKLFRGFEAEGIEGMQKARIRDSKLPSAELTAAQFYVSKNNAVDAEKWFKAAILADRTNVVFWNEYLKWLLISERIDNVRAALDKLPAGVKEHRDMRLMSALAARYQGELAAAETILAALVQSNPDDTEAADQLALVLIESTDEGKRGRALQLSELNLRKLPGVQNTIATAAWVHFKLGAIDVADRLLGELSQQTALMPQTAHYVAEVLKARGKKDDAIKVLELSVQSPGVFVERQKARDWLKSQSEGQP